MNSQDKIAVIGLGYVGLPLAVEFSRKYAVTGFDVNEKRVNELRSGNDITVETDKTDLCSVLKKSNDNLNGLFVTSNDDDIAASNIYIITVPTPINKHNKPDLSILLKASETAGKVLNKGDIVIYESTVYPGVTEDECVPALEKISRLKYNIDFYVGYSPERINPGDKAHSISKVKKITSGSTIEAAKIIDELYNAIVDAGTHSAPSIKVAEAAKVIENAQRDINIAFVNELAKIFNLLNIDTQDVLKAASTKWNFLPFRPGLVGGHCIGVASYYLAQKAQEAGYSPDIILAGRRLNDGMGAYVADEVIKLMLRKGIEVVESKILILGFTFKEDCADIRDTRVIDIVSRLKEYHANVYIHDPLASAEEVKHEYNLQLDEKLPEQEKFDAIILAVAHKQFFGLNIHSLSLQKCVVYDVKSVLPKSAKITRL